MHADLYAELRRRPSASISVTISVVQRLRELVRTTPLTNVIGIDYTLSTVRPSKIIEGIG